MGSYLAIKNRHNCAENFARKLMAEMTERFKYPSFQSDEFMHPTPGPRQTQAREKTQTTKKTLSVEPFCRAQLPHNQSGSFPDHF